MRLINLSCAKRRIEEEGSDPRSPAGSHALGSRHPSQSVLDRRQFFAGLASIIAICGAHGQAALPADRVWNPRTFGSKSDGRSLDTHALQQAIDACHAAGGGTVQVSRGTYLIGSIFLKTRVTLLLDEGAILQGSSRLADYRAISGGGEQPQEKGAGVSLISARGADKVAILGNGVIDGNGKSFIVPNARHTMSDREEWTDVSAFYWKPLERPQPMIDFIDCTGVHVSGVVIRNSPSWTLRILACDGAEIEGVTIDNPSFMPNSDGIDIVCSRNVTIKDCTITTGDDAICIKSEESFGLMRPTSNVSISDCVVDTPCNGIKIGTGSQGAVFGIAVRNCKVSQTHQSVRDRMISALAFEVVDGGSLRDCVYENIVVTGARTPIFIRLGDRGTNQPAMHEVGTLDGIQIRDVHATGAISSSVIAGLPNHPVRNVEWKRVSIASREAGPREWAGRIPSEVPSRYPEANMFGRLPSAALYLRHVNGIGLSDLRVQYDLPEFRPAIVCEDVRNLKVQAMALNRAGGDAPVFRFKDTYGEIADVIAPSSKQPEILWVGGSNQVDIRNLHRKN